MTNTRIILGPPGTGKTTKLLDILEKELSDGVEPNKIAFLSFTKKSVAEALERVNSRFKLEKSDLYYFRTIHSLAFTLMGLKRDRIMQKRDYSFIGDNLGLTFNVVTSFDDMSPCVKNAGDQYVFIDGFSRSRKINPSDVWEFINHDGLNWWEFERYVNTVKEYKKENDLWDFPDLLNFRPEPLKLDVCIIDEAQDLSTSQWDFIEHTFSKTKRMYIAGDDDQAIFEWSGADVNRFINKKGIVEVLKQSYRVPKEIHSFATNITDRIHNRVNKMYSPKPENGIVDYWGDVDSIDMSSGTWLLLARNGYLINEMGACTKKGGYRYSLKNMDSVPKADVTAITLWEKYRCGLILSPKEIMSLSSYTSNINNKCIWHEAFDKLEIETIEYYISLLRSGESLTKPPRINISTIHGSKGGEADHVVLLTDMAYSTWDATSLNTDSENRVWYVAATRAKESLNIIMPRGRYFYQL